MDLALTDSMFGWEKQIPCLDGPGAPGASLPSSCALGRQRFQRRRLHWHFLHKHQQQKQLHHQQRLPAAYAEQPREPDAQQTARLHLGADDQNPLSFSVPPPLLEVNEEAKRDEGVRGCDDLSWLVGLGNV